MPIKISQLIKDIMVLETVSEESRLNKVLLHSGEEILPTLSVTSQLKL